MVGDFLLEYLTHDSVFSKDLKELESRAELRDSFYQLLEELDKEFEQEDRKLDKRLKLNTRSYSSTMDIETK